jgi:hypothetical protein
MNLYTDFKLLEDSLLVLSGKSDDQQTKHRYNIFFFSYTVLDSRFSAATELKAHVELAARELSLERFSKFENELYSVSLFLWFHSSFIMLLSL